MLFSVLCVTVYLHVTQASGLETQQQQSCVSKEIDAYSYRGPIRRLDVSCGPSSTEGQVRDALENVTLTNKLVSLMLKGMELKYLVSQLLAGVHLQRIGVERCNLSSMDEHVFADSVDTLEMISLDHNELERVPTSSLQNLIALKQLHLNYNRLEVLQADSFKGLHSLEVLSLIGNKLRFIDDAAFEVGSKIDRMFLHNNVLTHFPFRPLSRLSSIQRLDLTDNEISFLQPEEIAGMNGHSLNLLSLQQNRIRYIPPRTFESLKSLDTLVLRKNAIEYIHPLAFHGIEDTLFFISIAGNQLQEVPAASFRKLNRLEQLHLQDNHICTMRKDDFVPYGKTLKYLYFQNNSLTSVEPTSFDSLDNLSELYLQSNQLTSFPYETYAPLLDTMRILYIAGNPFHCDCNIAWLKNYTQKTKYSKPKCASPEEYADMMLKEIPKDLLTCKNSTSRPPLSCVTKETEFSFITSSSYTAISDVIVILKLSLTVAILGFRI